MARTTIAIEDALLRQIKLRAARDNRPLQAVVNDLLRAGLRTPPARRFVFRFPVWHGVLNPNIDLDDRNSLWDAMEAPMEAHLEAKESRD